MTLQFPDFARVIRLKHRETYTKQGCLVHTKIFTDLQGNVTEDVVLSTPKQEKRK